MFLSSSKRHLGHDEETKFKAGTIIIMVNKDTREIIGVAIAQNWADSNSPCRLHSPLDADVYSGEYTKYNEHEICISNLRILQNPITYSEVRTLVGGVKNDPTNMWKSPQRNYRTPYTSKKGDQTPVMKYKDLVKSLL